MRRTTTGLLALAALGIGYLLGASGPPGAVAQGTNPPPIIVDRVTELQSAIMQTNRRVTTLERSNKTLEADLQAVKAKLTTAEAAIKKLRNDLGGHKHAQ